MFEDLRRRVDDVLAAFEAHRAPASRHFSAAVRGLSDALRAAGVHPPLLAGFEGGLGSLHAERRVRSSATPARELRLLVAGAIRDLLGSAPRGRPLASPGSGPTVILLTGLPGAGTTTTPKGWRGSRPAFLTGRAERRSPSRQPRRLEADGPPPSSGWPVLSERSSFRPRRDEESTLIRSPTRNDAGMNDEIRSGPRDPVRNAGQVGAVAVLS